MTVSDIEVRTTLPAATDAEIAAIDAWWRADNYLTIGQIYLQDNVLLTSRCDPSTSSRDCSDTGEPAPASRSSTPMHPGSSSTPASR